ncbi:hypothetical protein ACFQPA_01020 [Halomarina halobia]|uniref:DUF7847 domain-containing protein n=1 Tax=Halomarina halobia TaxID=3033386 RepID=A0ABD6A6S6_9EURY|nr:hypothetical protein [Halomarina sp. PSR21]
MALDIGSALSDGASRAFERNGLLLLALFAALGIVSGLAGDVVASEVSRQVSEIAIEAAREQGDPAAAREIRQSVPSVDPVVPMPIGAAVALALAGFVLSEAARVVADRTFVSDATETLYEPTRNLPLAVVNGVVALVVVALVVAVGFVVGLVGLLVGGPVLAAFLAVSLFFVRQEIAVEDKNFVDALVGSWSLARGDRLALFVLALALFIVGVLVSSGLGIVLVFLPPVLAYVANAVVSAGVGVFASAVAADAYRQLVAQKRGDAGRANDDRLADADEWDDPVR